MQPKFFKTANDFRQWLAKNHSTQTELLVGFHKKASGKPSMTWPESVDQALCFGWIMTAKKEETRHRRLQQLIVASLAGERLKQFVSKKK